MVGTPLLFVKKSPPRLDSHLFLTRRLPKLTRPTPANFFTANPPIALHSLTRAALLSQAPR